MLPTKTVQITLGGEERILAYRFKAFQALGLSGPLDGDGWDRAVAAATKDFEGAAKFIHAGLLHDPREGETVAKVQDAMGDWDTSELLANLNAASMAVFGQLLNGAGKGGDEPARPTDVPVGTNPGPSADTTSESAPMSSGA